MKSNFKFKRLLKLLKEQIEDFEEIGPGPYYEINKDNINELKKFFIDQGLEYIDFYTHIEFYSYFNERTDYDDKGEIHIGDIFDELEEKLPVRGTSTDLALLIYDILQDIIYIIAKDWRDEVKSQYEEEQFTEMYNYIYDKEYDELLEEGYNEDEVEEIIRDKAKELSKKYFTKDFEYGPETLTEKDVVNVIEKAVKRGILKRIG